VSCVKATRMQIPRVVSAFLSTRGLPTLINGITSSGGVAPFDPVAADALLHELRGLLACIQELLAFLHRTALSAVHPKPVPRDLLEIMGDGDHARAVKELQAAYSTLEAAFIQRSVAKAIEWDSVLPVCTLAALCPHCCAVLCSGAHVHSTSGGAIWCAVIVSLLCSSPWSANDVIRCRAH
jgi:phosphotransferase system HPr-like phosphotransfer protein